MGKRSIFFTPVHLGPYELANRLVMAPLTRSVHLLATPDLPERLARGAELNIANPETF